MCHIRNPQIKKTVVRAGLNPTNQKNIEKLSEIRISVFMQDNPTKIEGVLAQGSTQNYRVSLETDQQEKMSLKSFKKSERSKAHSKYSKYRGSERVERISDVLNRLTDIEDL